MDSWRSAAPRLWRGSIPMSRGRLGRSEMTSGAIAREQPRTIDLVGDAVTPTDRKVAHQGSEGLGQPKVVAREGDDRPSLLVTNVSEPQPDDTSDGLPVENDERSGDAIGHGDAVVGHQPASIARRCSGVGEGRRCPTRRAWQGDRGQVALLGRPRQKRDRLASSGAGTDQPFLDVDPVRPQRSRSPRAGASPACQWPTTTPTGSSTSSSEVDGAVCSRFMAVLLPPCGAGRGSFLGAQF